MPGNNLTIVVEALASALVLAQARSENVDFDFHRCSVIGRRR